MSRATLALHVAIFGTLSFVTGVLYTSQYFGDWWAASAAAALVVETVITVVIFDND